MKSSYVASITVSGVSGEVKLVAQALLATSVALVDAGCPFLSSFYSKLPKDESKTSGTETWSLVCSIAWRVFKDIALRPGLTRFVDFKNGVKQQVVTEYLWASLQAHCVWPSTPCTISDTTLRSHRLSTALCIIIECRGQCTVSSRRKSAKPFVKPQK